MTAIRAAFVPRYRALAWTAIGVGGGLATVAAVVLGAAIVPLATGIVGVALGGAYLASPSWRIVVEASDDGLRVRSPAREHFFVAWSEVVRVLASPTTHTLFLDGGDPSKSLLVPGIGAPAPYDLRDKAALYDAIVARVDPARVQIVETIEAARAALTPASAPGRR